MAANRNMDTNSKTPPDGVYKNERLMYACTILVGSTVHLQTKVGSVWEGVFSTFSPDFTICLELAVEIDPKSNSKDCLSAALKNGKIAETKAFFDLKDIARISAVDVDLNFATKNTSKQTQLVTDSDISGFDPNKLGELRQLESWQDDDEDVDTANPELLSLDEVATSKNDSRNNSRGWDATDMFRYNERVHNVTTTYDDKLTEYTLPLPKHNSKDWRQKQEKAAAIAKEIEGNSKSQNRLAKEDDDGNEEEKYSAVIRPTTGPNTNHPPNQQSQSQAHHQQQSQSHHQQQSQSHQQQQSQSHQQQQSQSHQHQQSHQHHQQQLQPHQHQQQQSQQQSQQQIPHNQSRILPQNQKHFRNNRFNKTSRLDSLKDFSNKLTLASPPRQSSPQQSQSHQQSHPQQPNPQQPPPAVARTQQVQVTVSTASPSTTTISTSSTVPADTSAISERSDSSSISSQAKEHQSELARKSKLNPNAKEFVYKPRSPANNPGAQANGANQASTNGAAGDPANSSPMSQAPHAPYYSQVPMFPHGLSPHAQQHHAAQFMQNHTHQHFQNQIQYMSPVPPHFAQQMPQRYIRGNFQNYHHRGEHHNSVRPDYSQGSPMMAPTSTGQQFVPTPAGAPHPMNAYAVSPQQPMIYSGPPQSMYPMVQASFPQHMPHMVPNPPPYDGSAGYMPSQNYIVNQP